MNARLAAIAQREQAWRADQARIALGARNGNRRAIERDAYLWHAIVRHFAQPGSAALFDLWPAALQSVTRAMARLVDQHHRTPADAALATRTGDIIHLARAIAIAAATRGHDPALSAYHAALAPANDNAKAAA